MKLTISGGCLIHEREVYAEKTRWNWNKKQKYDGLIDINYLSYYALRNKTFSSIITEATFWD